MKEQRMIQANRKQPNRSTTVKYGFNKIISTLDQFGWIIAVLFILWKFCNPTNYDVKLNEASYCEDCHLAVVTKSEFWGLKKSKYHVRKEAGLWEWRLIDPESKPIQLYLTDWHSINRQAVFDNAITYSHHDDPF